MRTRLCIALILVTLSGLACAQPSADKVIADVKRTFNAVNDYRVDATLSVKGDKLSVRNMKMTIYYKKPGRMHIDAKQGFAFVPTGTFLGNSIDDMTRGAKATYLRAERRSGIDCHLIRLDPAGPGGNPISVLLWIDKARSVVIASRTEGEAQMSTTWTYSRVDGKYHLPTRIAADIAPPASGPHAGAMQKSQAVITFANYRVNKGIPDSVFEEKPKK